METAYIAGLDNGGLVFYTLSESEIEDFKKQWDTNRIYFIVPKSEFMAALSHLF